MVCDGVVGIDLKYMRFVIYSYLEVVVDIDMEVVWFIGVVVLIEEMLI